jgi:hypothetical protein
VHRRIYDALSSPPTSFVAQYLYVAHGKDLTISARYPICTVQVIKEMERMYGPLLCEELPRRLFRAKTGIDEAVRHLVERYHPSTNSHKGYPLCRAVLTHNYALAEYLLCHGADPSVRGALAVQVAIQTADLKAVSLLLRDRKIQPQFVEWAVRGKDQGIVGYFVNERGESHRGTVWLTAGMMPRLQSILGMKG